MRRLIGDATWLWLGLGLLSLVVVGCDDDATCGNGRVEGGETCDGSNLDGASCQLLGYTTGSLGCTDQCRFDVSGCDGLVDCGNEVIDSGEQCDGSDLGGETCETRALGGGTLACDPVTCQFDVTGCEGGVICGDGIADGNEECDGNDFRGQTCQTVDATYIGGQLDCSLNCTLRLSGCYGEPDFPIGQPCVTSDDCEGGICYPEMGGYLSGAPGGMCVERCGEDGSCPLAGEAGVCVSSGWGPSYCYRRCDPVSPDCRPGYECVVEGDRGYCYPHCTEDAQCVVTGDCDTDPTSYSEGFCVVPDEVCTGGVDEDLDGLVDCSDPDCNGVPGCPLGEICFNGVDDDGDTLVDCDDGECVMYGVCSGDLCVPPAGAVLTCGTQLTGESNNASGSTTIFDRYRCMEPDDASLSSLWGETGPEYAYTLTVTSSQLVTVTVGNFSNNLDVVVVKEYAGQYCDPAAGCFEFGRAQSGLDEVLIFTAHPTMTYYVIVDGRQGDISTYDIDVTCDATGYEDCGNSFDDDGDGLDDCNDPDCFDVPPYCSSNP